MALPLLLLAFGEPSLNIGKKLERTPWLVGAVVGMAVWGKIVGGVRVAAEWEKRATITKAEGDRLAAINLTEAAKLMQSNPIALELRTLQTIDGLATSPSNTVVLFPMELGHMLKSVVKTAPAQPEAPPPLQHQR